MVPKLSEDRLRLALQARKKVEAGLSLSDAEKRALDALEQVEAHTVFLHQAESVPIGVYCEWSGRQHKVVKEQAERYGLPIGGKTVSIPAALHAFHDLIAKFHGKLVPSGIPATDDDVLAEAMWRSKDPLQAAFIKQRIRKEKRQNDVAEGLLIDAGQIAQDLTVIGRKIANAIEQFERRFGVEVGDAFRQLVDDIGREINMVTPSTETDNAKSE